MAVEVISSTSRLRIQFVESRDHEGREKLSSRSYNNVKTDADNEAVYKVSTEIIGLQDKEGKTIIRIDEKELVEG